MSIDDRAFTFGDGVYEVCEIRRRSADRGGAASRPARALARGDQVRLADRRGALRLVMREVVRRNRVRDGLVYLQVSRGAARRDHGFPLAWSGPASSSRRGRSIPLSTPRRAAAGRRRRHRPQFRWAHPHIKTLQLLPNVLAKQPARDAARSRPGSSTEPASSPKAPRPTPGSSPATAWSPGRRTARSCGRGARGADRRRRAASASNSRSGRSRSAEALCGARGVPLQRDAGRHAGGSDRRAADRRRPAGRDGAGAETRLPRACRSHMNGATPLLFRLTVLMWI